MVAIAPSGITIMPLRSSRLTRTLRPFSCSSVRRLYSFQVILYLTAFLNSFLSRCPVRIAQAFVTDKGIAFLTQRPPRTLAPAL